jgi:RNA polymerase sigma-70 factor (ECF subfamily)
VTAGPRCWGAARAIYDDDEEFWEWYERDEMTRWEDVAAEPTSLTPEEVVEVHRLTLAEIARALGITPQEAARLLADARRHAVTKKDTG